jgi:hypothetical protein
VKGRNYVEATVLGCLEGLKIIEEALKSGLLHMQDMETMWIDVLLQDIHDIPRNEDKFVEMMLPALKNEFIPSEYGL